MKRDESPVDELAKALANAVSRREALRRVGRGLGALLLAPLGRRAAWADPGNGRGEGCGIVCNRAFAPNSQDPAIKAANKQCKAVCEVCDEELCIHHDRLSTDCCTGFEFCLSGICVVTCFTAGTRITMADGSERPIEEVRVGDQLLGPEGETNRVVGVERPPLGNRKLYALNGSDYFVTAEHPFMTDDGWKAIDPAATALENPRLAVGPLKVGDLLSAMHALRVPVAAGGRAAVEPVLPQLVSIPLTGIQSRSADPDTPLYNLLLDGAHVYFANGFLAHNRE